jgi:hypothetical protein
MTPETPRRRELLAYAAGIAVIAGLMSVVVWGGGMVTARKTTDLSSTYFSASSTGVIDPRAKSR